jgi:hypothetical protein
MILTALKRTLCLILLAAGITTANGQGVTDYFFQQKDCVQEKLHLTTDRPYYAPGDTVWFRGTLVAADNLSYMLRTNYIYVELIDPLGDVRLRRKVRREGLCFQHCLPLDSTLTGGRYQLRGYTSWMRNFAPDNFFHGELLIVSDTGDDTDAPATESLAGSPDFDVTFLPEGGNRIAGCRQKIAFKALGDDGIPVEVTGAVHPVGSTRTVATLSSLHDGMGWFYLEGADNQPDVTLEATVTLRDQTDAAGMAVTRSFTLPEATGRWALTVEATATEDSVRYHILTPRTHATDTLWLLLHSGANLVEMRPVVAGGEGTLFLRDCRVGVNQLVLCTAAGIGLSRRLLFRQADETSRPQVDCRITAPDAARQEGHMELTLTDAPGHPLRGDFSVSLLDATFIDTTLAPPTADLTSDLLLDADLHGPIYHSAYYTDPTVPRATRAEALECVLLTHGWSRFATDTMQVHGVPHLLHPLESNEWVSGYVDRFFNRRDRRDLERVAISIVDTMGGSWGTAMLDSTGHFFVGNLDYPDRMPLMVRLLSYSANPHYHFDRPTFPDLTFLPSRERLRRSGSATAADSLYRAWLQSLQSRTTRLLGDVVVTDRRPGNGKVKYQQIFDAAEISQTLDLYNYPTALDVVNEFIRFHPALKYADVFDDDQKLFTFKEGNAYPVYIQGAPNLLQDKDPHDRRPTLLLRGVKNKNLYASDTALELLRSEDIMSIEFLQRDTNYVIVTFKPNTYITSARPNRRAVTFYSFGYTEPQYFYHPRYRTRLERDYPKLDVRKTLSWFPSIQTDTEGHIDVRFYTSDHPTRNYLLQVEGVTFRGDPVSVRKRLGE